MAGELECAEMRREDDSLSPTAPTLLAAASKLLDRARMGSIIRAEWSAPWRRRASAFQETSGLAARPEGPLASRTR